MELIYGNKYKELQGITFMSWDELHANKQRPSKPYTLVTHEGDGQINESHLHILNDSNLIKWYAINVNILHPKLVSIPLGIEYRLRDENKKVFEGVLKKNIEKNKNIYCNFAIHSWVEERKRCKDAMDRNGLEMSKTTMCYKDYLMQLASHDYALCPIGNGIDTFRVWECLYLGVIPICARKINSEQIKLVHFDAEYYDTLPVLFIDNWETFDINILDKKRFLNNPYFNNDALNFSNWRKLITGK